MWDLIVSVPDHCLSFYLINEFVKRWPPTKRTLSWKTGITLAAKILYLQEHLLRETKQGGAIKGT